MAPTVSFVVPCYNLAHLLPECLDSILGQTYRDFEILVMDDCSPDDTGAVAQSYADPRIRYIRNEVNLKHLQNYNKGISQARGKYIWLISADDRLRRPYALEKYVSLLDKNPNVGYVFCPGVGLFNGEETGVLDYSIHGEHDAIFDGRQFLRTLIHSNTIVAASGLVRKECYDVAGLFPLDLPWGGDWYLWCAFALHFDVGYLAEPMVCYRRHESSMTKILMGRDIGACYSDDIRIPWMIKAQADGMPGCGWLAKECLRSVAGEYARRLAGKHYKQAATWVEMTAQEFEESLCQQTSSVAERQWIRARVYARLADHYQAQQKTSLARKYYYKGLCEDFSMGKTWAKWILASSGKLGNQLRRYLPELRRAARMNSR